MEYSLSKITVSKLDSFAPSHLSWTLDRGVVTLSCPLPDVTLFAEAKEVKISASGSNTPAAPSNHAVGTMSTTTGPPKDFKLHADFAPAHGKFVRLYNDLTQERWPPNWDNVRLKNLQWRLAVADCLFFVRRWQTSEELKDYFTWKDELVKAMNVVRTTEKLPPVKDCQWLLDEDVEEKSTVMHNMPASLFGSLMANLRQTETKQKTVCEAQARAAWDLIHDSAYVTAAGPSRRITFVATFLQFHSL